MKTIKNNWKVALIVAVGIITIILLGVFCIQSSQNRAFTLEEQVNTADSDIKVQEKRRVDLVYNHVLRDCMRMAKLSHKPFTVRIEKDALISMNLRTKK